MQATLGNQYYIIEEGLGGRTTNLEHPNPNKPSRNGLSYFAACLDSHSPLDIVIIMLGTNDFKTSYDRSVPEIANALQLYVDTIKNSYDDSSAKQPIIIIVSPPYMNQDAPLFYSSMPTAGIYDETSVVKSHELSTHLKQLAESNGVTFLDAAPTAETGDDGCHMTESAHNKLGAALAITVRQATAQ